MNMEEEFFLYFKKQLFNEDIIKIPESFVLNKLNNKLKIFYNVNSIWFSRLKVSDEETYYYFGLYDENCINENIIQPKILLKSNPKKVSSLRFLKNDCYLLIRLSNNSKELKKLKKSFSLKKSKKKNFYYLNLGNLNSKSLMINITYFLNEFDLKINLKNNYILISESFKVQKKKKKFSCDSKVQKKKKKFSSDSKVQNNNNIISDEVYRRRTLELFNKIDFESDIYLNFVKLNGIEKFSPQQQYDYLYSKLGYEKLYDTLKDIKLNITLKRRERERKEYDKIFHNVQKKKKKFSSDSKVQNNNNIISDEVYRRRTLELFNKIDFESDIYLNFVKLKNIEKFSPQQQYDYLYSKLGYEKLYDTLKDIKLKITLERREKEKKEHNKILYNQKKEMEERKIKEELFVLFEEKIYRYPHFYEHLIDSHNIVYPKLEDQFNCLFDKYDYSKLQDIFDELLFKIKVYDLFIELESRPSFEYKQFIESNSIQGLSRLKRFDYLYDKNGGQKLYDILTGFELATYNKKMSMYSDEFRKNSSFSKNRNSLPIANVEKILKN